jgi:hypothetical protein
VDPRGYPVDHPNLTFLSDRIETFSAEAFDAILCLSTLEHIGSGDAGQPGHATSDRAAMQRIADLTTPGGLLVLTTQLGPRFEGRGGRVYDYQALKELLSAFEIKDMSVVRQSAPTVWIPSDRVAPSDSSLALITATRNG